MTSVSYYLKCGRIKDVSTNSLLVVPLPDLPKEHDFQSFPRASKEEFDSSCSSGDLATSELHLSLTRSNMG